MRMGTALQISRCILLFAGCMLLFAFPLLSFSQDLIPAPQVMKVKGQERVHLKSVDARLISSRALGDEGYTLRISGSRAILRASSRRGLIWARATLSQLRDSDGTVPRVAIRDWPEFPIRGFMHDTGRNFRSIERLRAELRLLSAYKINVFHWHLTDNPAWRIECKAYPQLNDPKYQTKGRDEGKYYTYREIRSLIAYADSLGITVIPEIDMPGHSQYFRTTFGFTMDSPEGRKVIERCIDEFFSEVPASSCPYFHIGSDEIRIKDPASFIAFAENLILRHGSIPITWDPGLPSSEKAVKQIWSGSVGEKINSVPYLHKYLDSFMGYLNYGDPVLNVSRFFLHRPCGTGVASEKALGGILCLWNDVRVEDKSLTFPQNGMPAGLLAFSERLWRGGGWINRAADFCSPLPEERGYAELLDFESRLASHRDHRLYSWDMRWVANAAEAWLLALPSRRGTAMRDMKWVPSYGGVVDFNNIITTDSIRQFSSMDAWRLAEVYSPADTVITAWAGFDVPGRANRRSSGIGQQGYWENNGRIFVNGSEVFPSRKWKEPGAYCYPYDTWGGAAGEIPYTAEQFYWMRPQVARLPLRRGWNRILIYCPRYEYADRWITAFIPVSFDSCGHVSEVKGLKWRKPSEIKIPQ